MSTACSSSPVIGTGTFYPSAGFNFPRSYISSVVFALTGWVWTAVDVNVWEAFFFGFPTSKLHVSLKPEAYAWSSNVYSLPFVLCESWYWPVPFVEAPADYVLVCDRRENLAGFDLVYLNSAFAPGDEATFRLPAPPAGYWLPPLD